MLERLAAKGADSLRPHTYWTNTEVRDIAPKRQGTQHRWSPRYVKHSIDDGKKVKIAAIDPDFRSRPQPLSLMEFAGRSLITGSRSKRRVACRFVRPRSDLSCHHVMIA
jgi:hypothetical protein